MSDNVEPDYNLDHDLWQEDWAEQFRGNYETFINPLSIKAMQTELTRLRDANSELKDLIMRCILDYEGYAEVCAKYNFKQTRQDALESAEYLRKALAKHKMD